MSTSSEEMRHSSEEDDAEKKRMVARTSWITTSSRCAPTQNNKMALYTDSKAGIGIETSRSVENLGAQSDNKPSTLRPFTRARSAPYGDIESKDSGSEDPNAYTGALFSSRQLTARQEYTWALALAIDICLKQQKVTQTHSAQGSKRAETQEHDKAEKAETIHPPPQKQSRPVNKRTADASDDDIDAGDAAGVPVDIQIGVEFAADSRASFEVLPGKTSMGTRCSWIQGRREMSSARRYPPPYPSLRVLHIHLAETVDEEETGATYLPSSPQQ
ncbi:hypothetical protein DFH08DRAFT_459016 [Mycena albidolilacea]|uniref:Uncharacterized protein n=1 Tax=Mycena albidolilacea TaxID=1033008 RepID=A0AAD7AE26_9AGAR|nr:hypothetical protein DFH08DRAFT_459016 [Mycena albidolilacea]